MALFFETLRKKETNKQRFLKVHVISMKQLKSSTNMHFLKGAIQKPKTQPQKKQFRTGRLKAYSIEKNYFFDEIRTLVPRAVLSSLRSERKQNGSR